MLKIRHTQVSGFYALHWKGINGSHDYKVFFYSLVDNYYNIRFHTCSSCACEIEVKVSAFGGTDPAVGNISHGGLTLACLTWISV